MRNDDGEAGHTRVTPRLHFPEFAGELWDTKPLEEVAPLQRGFDLPSSDLQPGNVPVVYSNGVQRFHSTAMATAPGLVTGRSGTIGKLHFIESGGYWPHNTSLWVTSFKENIPKFVYFLFESIGMGRFSSGSGVPTLNRNDVHAFVSCVPRSLAEQQKIAECLTSLDEVIAAQGRKVEALKTHKRSLMQQLFPREGETRPLLRFPEFRDAPEWGVSSLGALAKIQTGKKDANEGAPDGQYPFFTCAENHIYSDGYSFDAEAILIAGNANVGQTRYYKGKFEAYQRTYVLTEFGDVHVPYLYAFLNSNLRSALLAQVQTSAMSYIRLPMLSEFPVSNPPSVREQQRIADCLSSLDRQIAAESTQFAALKTHKKGLVQQLFPAPDATGE